MVVQLEVSVITSIVIENEIFLSKINYKFQLGSVQFSLWRIMLKQNNIKTNAPAALFEGSKRVEIYAMCNNQAVYSP